MISDEPLVAKLLIAGRDTLLVTTERFNRETPLMLGRYSVIVLERVPE